jgi:hypothetical protein
MQKNGLKMVRNDQEQSGILYRRTRSCAHDERPITFAKPLSRLRFKNQKSTVFYNFRKTGLNDILKWLEH